MTLCGSAVAAPTARLATLRGNCMGAAVLVIIQFGIGIGVNLYSEVPKNRTFLPAVFSSTALAAHAIVAVVPSCPPRSASRRFWWQRPPRARSEATEATALR